MHWLFFFSPSSINTNYSTLQSDRAKNFPFFLPLACGANESLHVIQVTLQRAPSRRGKPVFGFRHALVDQAVEIRRDRLTWLAGGAGQCALTPPLIPLVPCCRCLSHKSLFPPSRTRPLPSVVPRDPETKAHLQYAKSPGHKRIAPVCRGKQGDSPDGHQAKPHDRYDPHGKSAASDNGRAIKEQPDARERRVNSRLKQ